jgi:threonyl-tRNA synthetase
MVKQRNEELDNIRHSTAHIMADAVKRLYPGVKLGMGPAIDEGFYYDFDIDKPFTPEDLSQIKKEMIRIIKQNMPFEQKMVTKEEAMKMLEADGEIYKLEILQDIPDQEVSIYTHGEFFDLCKGPHVESTGKIRAFKLLSVAGAYWKGTEENAMLQRIYGTAFDSKEKLNEYVRLREEAEKRDHRKLGKELELFSFNEEMGAGLVLYLPKGAMLRQIIVDYITKKHLEKEYQLISSPHIMKSDIWVKSGHYEYYKENMYTFESDASEYAVKPMNCPGHILAYESSKRSYRELPIRYFELGNVYRHEKSGVLHGLLRVRGFTQDDAHIFCLKEQASDEISKVISFVDETLKVFGFKGFEVELSTRPEKSIGTDEDWEAATEALKQALEAQELEYDINEGDGAFYGPKIDIKLTDAIGRSWQCATVQCDFALPERFDLKYTDSDGKEKRPVVLHRVVLGSLERFIGTLIEHYGGAFPLWLAPVQVMIVPITDANIDYAKGLEKELKRSGIRCEIDMRSEKMQRKIRDAELAKIPYMAVVGNKEEEKGEVAPRSKKEGNLGSLKINEFVNKLNTEVEEKLSW